MANFETAFALTEHIEAGYANNPNDHGGETYAGIARNFWPNWSGWTKIDGYKKTGMSELNTILKMDLPLQDEVASFYKQNFWDINKLDLVSNQQLANNVYDFGVNSGVGKAAKTLQDCAGVTADGIIGNQTIAAVNSANAETIYNCYNATRSAFYNKLAANPGQAQFLHSWLSRIKPYLT